LAAAALAIASRWLAICAHRPRWHRPGQRAGGGAWT